MSEDTLTRTVKEFGNGAHITLPSEWIGGVVEAQLVALDRPELFEGLEEGSHITVELTSGGTLYGEVEQTKKVEYPDGTVDFEVVCSMKHGTPHDDSEASSSQDIREASGVDIRDVSEFELVVSRPPNEPWGDTVSVRYYEGEFCEQIEGVESHVGGVKYTVSKEV